VELHLAERIEVPDRVLANFLPNTNHCVCWNIKIHYAAGSNHCIPADFTWTYDHGSARNPSTRFYHDISVQRLTSQLTLGSCHPEVVGASQ